MQTTANLLFFIARCLAVTAEVALLRTGFGRRYLGLHAFLAVPLAFVYMLFWPGHDLRPLLLYLGLYLLMCAVARMQTLARGKRSNPVHSRYDGVPRLARLFPRLDEITVKRVAEPLTLLVVAILVSQFNQPLGVYLLLSAVALFITIHTNLAFEEVRAMDMHDALIDQQQAAMRLRDLRGVSWPNLERNPP
jgi:hypothetical protein